MHDLIPADPVEAVFLGNLLFYLIFLLTTLALREIMRARVRRTEQQIIEIRNMIDAHDQMMAEAEEASRARGA